GSLTVNGESTFKNNAAVNGGAIYNNAPATFGGGFVSFEGNKASANGGAIYNYVGTIVVDGNLDFNENAASEGDAIYNQSSIVINRQTSDGQDESVTLLERIFGNEDINEFFDF
ncbi:MAG: hypothetical protein IJM54_01175, partial [Thermoguttaceae bacterium]|nr:hypothetical protein [Thermoguttaceae bacterium]